MTGTRAHTRTLTHTHTTFFSLPNTRTHINTYMQHSKCACLGDKVCLNGTSMLLHSSYGANDTENGKRPQKQCREILITHFKIGKKQKKRIQKNRLKFLDGSPKLRGCGIVNSTGCCTLLRPAGLWAVVWPKLCFPIQPILQLQTSFYTEICRFVTVRLGQSVISSLSYLHTVV